jgi:hypothetical protein
MANTSGFGLVSHFWTDLPGDGFNSEAADDIVVPSGGWEIGGIFVGGQYFNGPGSADSVDVIVRGDNAGLPDDANILCSYLGYGIENDAAADLSIELSPTCSLAEGTYWLSVVVNMPRNPNGQYGWEFTTARTGSAGAWRNPGDAFGTGCTDWTLLDQCAALAGGGITEDFAFQLYGPSVPDEICIDEQIIYSTDHEDGSGDWATSEDGAGVSNPWQLNTDGGSSGANYWFVADIDGAGNYSDSYLDSPEITIPAGASDVYVRFTHNFDLESGFDGGVLEVDTNGGGFTYVDSSAFTEGAYTAVISTGFSSPIGGLAAFTGTAGGYGDSQADLAAVAGDTIILRFREANDISVSQVGWSLDDVEVGYCAELATETPDGPTSTPTDAATEVPTDVPTNTPGGPTETATPTEEPPGTELLDNGDFENLDGDGKPDITPWVVKNSSGDKAKCNKDKDGDGIPDKIFANTGNCAFAFKGVTAEAGKLEQTIDLTGLTLNVGDTLNLTFAAQTKGGGEGKAKVVFKYGDDTKTKISVTVGATDDVYAPFAGTADLTSADITKSKINFKMTTEVGKMYVDGVSLRLVAAAGGTPTEEPTVEATPTETETPAARLNSSK